MPKSGSSTGYFVNGCILTLIRWVLWTGLIIGTSKDSYATLSSLDQLWGWPSNMSSATNTEYHRVWAIRTNVQLLELTACVTVIRKETNMAYKISLDRGIWMPYFLNWFLYRKKYISTWDNSGP